MKGRRRRSRIGVSLITLSPCFSFGFLGFLHWLARAFGFLLSRRYAFFAVAISLASHFRHDQVLRGLITVTVIPNAAKIFAKNLRIVRHLQALLQLLASATDLPHVLSQGGYDVEKVRKRAVA